MDDLTFTSYTAALAYAEPKANKLNGYVAVGIDHSTTFPPGTTFVIRYMAWDPAKRTHLERQCEWIKPVSRMPSKGEPS